MKATELRPGNHILGNTGIETVKYIQPWGDTPGYEYLIHVEENGNQYKIFEVSPLEASDFLIENLGFQGRIDFKTLSPLDKVAIHIIDGELFIAIKDISGVFYRTTVKLGYIHQLQNVCLDIDGKMPTFTHNETGI